MMGGKYSSIREIWNLVPAHGNQIGTVMVMKEIFGRSLVTRTLKGSEKQFKIKR